MLHIISAQCIVGTQLLSILVYCIYICAHLISIPLHPSPHWKKTRGYVPKKSNHVPKTRSYIRAMYPRWGDEGAMYPRRGATYRGLCTQDEGLYTEDYVPKMRGLCTQDKVLYTKMGAIYPRQGVTYKGLCPQDEYVHYLYKVCFFNDVSQFIIIIFQHP